MASATVLPGPTLNSLPYVARASAHLAGNARDVSGGGPPSIRTVPRRTPTGPEYGFHPRGFTILAISGGSASEGSGCWSARGVSAVGAGAGGAATATGSAGSAGLPPQAIDTRNGQIAASFAANLMHSHHLPRGPRQAK